MSPSCMREKQKIPVQHRQMAQTPFFQYHHNKSGQHTRHTDEEVSMRIIPTEWDTADDLCTTHGEALFLSILVITLGDTNLKW